MLPSFVFPLVTFLAQAQTAASPATNATQPGGGLLQSPLIPLVCFVVIFYFLLIRPQQKRAKKQAELVSSLKSGDRVLTSSGIYGYVSNLDDKIVTVKIAEGVKVDMDRNCVTTILNRKGAE